MQFPYLYKRKMDYHGNGATKDSVSTKLCTMAHTVMATISSNDNSISQCLQFREHCTLVLLPVNVDCWKEMILQIQGSNLINTHNRIH